VRREPCQADNLWISRPGSFRLVPPEEVLGALRSDYGRMRQMLFDDPMPFDELVGGLRALEARINSYARCI